MSGDNSHLTDSMAASFSFRNVISVLGIGAILACGVGQQSSSPVPVILRSFGDDSLCDGKCSFVIVDSVVRLTDNLLPYYPYRSPIDFRFSVSSIGYIGGVRPIGVEQWGQPGSGADTLLLSLYRVKQPEASTRTELFGVAVISPSRPLRTWAVRVGHASGGWKIVEKHVYYEP